jgi:glutamate dehydrogenase (NAD(P)+)
MDKRFEESGNLRLVSVVERMTGKSLTTEEKNLLIRGADEEDLVNSGLEDSMITSYHEIMDIWKSRDNVKDMRTAAFISAIDKIAMSYFQMGIFP